MVPRCLSSNATEWLRYLDVLSPMLDVLVVVLVDVAMEVVLADVVLVDAVMAVELAAVVLVDGVRSPTPVDVVLVDVLARDEMPKISSASTVTAM